MASDSGFALIEVMMSAVLVVVFATALLSVIEKSGNAAASNRSRGVATQLAQQDQDAMRLMAIKSLSNYHVVHDPQAIGGMTYTVTSDAEWLRDDAAGRVACDASSARVEYVKITSSVMWTNHPTPVIIESYVAPGVKGTALGSLTVKLHGDGANRPTAGVGVNYQGQTVATDSNGCAVFTTLDPGTSNATWRGDLGSPFMVDKNGSTTVSTSVNVGSSQNSIVDAMFDEAATVPVRFVDDVGNNPSWRTVSAANSGVQTPVAGVRRFDFGSKVPSGNAGLLFPFATAYVFYAGNCDGNAPTTWDTSGGSAHTGELVTQPATTSPTFDVKVPSVFAQTTVTSGSPGVATPVTNPVLFKPDTTKSKMSGCSETNTATPNASGQVNTALPWGAYTACVKLGTYGSGSTAKVWYARKPFFNTPPTTTGAEALTHELSALPSPYAGKQATIANFAISTTTSGANGMVSTDGSTLLSTGTSAASPC